jgi:predicted lipoprotein with Yx(FWY)xxD motif
MPVFQFAMSGNRLVMAIAALVLAFTLACSGDDDDTNGNGADAPEATATEAAPAETETTPEASDDPTPESTGGSEALTVGIASGDLGAYLTGPDGRSLYIFTRDMPDTSNCSGGCLETWPPLLLEDGQDVDPADGAAGAFDSIETESGQQVTYNGAPLYYFAPDAAAGDVNGHLVGNVWFLARPDTASTAYVGVSDTFLVGPTGFTLYTFRNDTEGVSNCSGGCLEAWPALTVPDDLDPTATADAGGELGVFVREDGVRHVTYNGLPLYYYAGDTMPGETTGDGVNDVWDLALP